MGVSLRSGRYRWEEDRANELKHYVEGRVKDGVSVTKALKEYGEQNNISWLTARWKYYQLRNQGTESERGTERSQGTESVRGTVKKQGRVRKEERARDEDNVEIRERDSGPLAKTSASSDEGQDDFLGYLRELMIATQDGGQDIVPFIKGLSRMAVLSRESIRARQENARLHEAYRAFLTSTREHCHRLAQWLQKGQVEKVQDLGDFMGAMREDLEMLERFLDSLKGA